MAEHVATTRIPDEWAYQPRWKRSSQPLPHIIGKTFGRITHQTVPFCNVLDEGKVYLALRGADVREIPDDWHGLSFSLVQIYCKFFTPIRHKYGPSLEKRLLNDNPKWDFRNSLSQMLQEGRAQARADDIAVLKSLCADWPVFSALPHGHTRGWATDKYAELLRTPDLNWMEPEIRQALDHGLIDAPPNQMYAGLYESYKFPSESEHPLTGFCRSELFVDATLGIFIGPRASKHLPVASRGRRSKASIAGMTSITKPSIAYVAMLLRFTLHQATAWYSIESADDSRFNYVRFYSEILALLEENEFKDEVEALIAYLNGKIFPHFHLLPRDVPSNGAQSTREKALAIIRARQT